MEEYDIKEEQMEVLQSKQERAERYESKMQEAYQDLDEAVTLIKSFHDIYAPLSQIEIRDGKMIVNGEEE